MAEVTWSGKKLLKLESKATSEVDAQGVIDGAEVILLYFSAHWCPPCRGFTPVLKDFYEEVEGDKVVIIFVSSDRTEADMLSYFTTDHGDYYAVKFDDQDLSKQLKTNCNISGIPCLAVVNKQGIMLHQGGRADVTSKGKAAVEEWKKKY